MAVLTVSIHHKSGMTVRDVTENIEKSIVTKNANILSVDVNKMNIQGSKYVYPIYHLAFRYVDVQLNERMLISEYEEQSVTEKSVRVLLEGAGYEIHKYVE